MNSTFPNIPVGEGLPNIDPTTAQIAEYLHLGLNTAMQGIYENVVVVRSTACYNSLPRDLSCFPLLKVYRNTDSFSCDRTNKTQATIGYCLSFPDEEKIPGILRWVAINIIKLLRKFAFDGLGCYPEIDTEEDLKAEYRVMSLNGEPVYMFLVINFTFKEAYE